MTVENISTFLFGYFLTAAGLFCISVSIRSTRLAGIIALVCSLISISGLAIVVSALQPGQNFLYELLMRVVSLSRTDITALGLGISCALPIAFLSARNPERKLSWLSVLSTVGGLTGALLFGILFLAKDAISPYIANSDSVSGSVGLGSWPLKGSSFKITSTHP